MILQALYRLAADEALTSDPDYPLVPVAWLVIVDSNGRLAGITDTRAEASIAAKKSKLVAKSFPVPYQAGRSGTKAPAFFFVDNAKYVFGRPTADKEFPASEGAQKSTWFREHIRECVDATNDAGAAAVLRFLEDVARGNQVFDVPADCRSNELFAFIYAPDVDQLVHMRPKVREYWQAVRRQAAALSATASNDGEFECIITGGTVQAPGLFPKVKHVPGAQSSGAPLVSFNASAFTSYGLENNENAPISREAAEACSAALQRLLHPAYPNPRPGVQGQPMPRRNYQLTADTVACYWSNSRGATDFLDAFANLFEPDPATIGDVYRSAWRGRPVPITDPGAFYALTLSGAQGRMIVRDWFTTSVREASVNLAKHFTDLAVVRNTPAPKGEDLPDALPLRVLLAALAPFGHRDSIPPSLATQVFSAALRGTPYPFSLLTRAIERTRAEIGKSEWADLERRDARVAIIKAVLNRRRRQHPSFDLPELTVALDPTNTSPGYLCGRLMAVIERLQQASLPEVNATVVDRFFGAASATPRAVFTRLLRNARHHARKAGDEASTAGIARWLESQLDAIVANFDVKANGFPAYLDLEQQGLFVLGYHQQRHELWKKRDSTNSPATAPAESTSISA
jgi:CRISPR-associated protein Csd1